MELEPGEGTVMQLKRGDGGGESLFSRVPQASRLGDIGPKLDPGSGAGMLACRQSASKEESMWVFGPAGSSDPARTW